MAQNAACNESVDKKVDLIITINKVIGNSESFHGSRNINHFRIISYELRNAFLLDAGYYKNELFGTRTDEGFEGGGYKWESLAQVFLEEKKPELIDIISFDSEISMFCTYSDDLDALYEFASAFNSVCEDNDLIVDLFPRAKLD